MPFEITSQAADRATSAEQPELRCGLPILVAEDNLVIQKVAAAQLRMIGLRYEIAADGYQVLSMSAEAICGHPDGLPDARDERLRSGAHAAGAGQEIPIIAVTAGAPAANAKWRFRQE